MEYRKKPVVVVAEPFTGTSENAQCLVAWIVESGQMARIIPNNGVLEIEIVTPEGRLKAVVGDFVFRNAKCEFYPCNPEAFLATYEPVERPPEERQVTMMRLEARSFASDLETRAAETRNYRPDFSADFQKAAKFIRFLSRWEEKEADLTEPHKPRRMINYGPNPERRLLGEHDEDAGCALAGCVPVAEPAASSREAQAHCGSGGHPWTCNCYPASSLDAQAQQAAQDERNVMRDLRASLRPSDDAFRFFTGGTIEVARLSREGAMRLAHDLFDLLDFGVPHLPGMPTEDQSLHRLLMTIYQLEGAMSFEAYEAKNGLDTTDHQRLLEQLARVRVAVRFAFRKLEETSKWLFTDTTPMEGPR